MASRQSVALKEEPRWKYVAFCAVLGAVLGSAYLLSGRLAMAAMCTVGLTAFGLIRRRYSELARVDARATDERHKAIVTEAGAFASVVMCVVLLAGSFWEAAHGYRGPFIALTAVFGASVFLGEFLAKRRL